MDVRINYFSADEARGYSSGFDESKKRKIKVIEEDEKYDSSGSVIEKFEKEPQHEEAGERPRAPLVVRIKQRSLKVIKFMFSKFMIYFWCVIVSWGLQETILAFLGEWDDDDQLTVSQTLSYLSVGWIIASFGAAVFLRSTGNGFISKIYPATWEFIFDKAIGYAFFAGVIGAIAPLGYYSLLAEGGGAARVTPLLSLFIVIPTLLGIFFLKEEVTKYKIIGILLSVLSVTLFATEDLIVGVDDGFSFFSPANIIWFMLGFGGSGISYFMRYIAAILPSSNDFGHLMFFAAIGQVFGNYGTVAFVLGPSLEEKVTLSPNPWVYILTIVAGMCGIAGDVGYLLMSKEGEASRVAPLLGCYSLVPVTVGILAMGNEVNGITVLAITSSVIAIVLLGMQAEKKDERKRADYEPISDPNL